MKTCSDISGRDGGDAVVSGVSTSALEAFLDSAADPEAGGAGRSDYNRYRGKLHTHTKCIMSQ